MGAMKGFWTGKTGAKKTKETLRYEMARNKMVIRGGQDGSRRCRLAASEGGLNLTDAFGDDHLPRTAEVLNRRFSKAAPCRGSERNGGEDLWTKGCAGRGAGATPPLYNFNL